MLVVVKLQFTTKHDSDHCGNNFTHSVKNASEMTAKGTHREQCIGN